MDIVTPETRSRMMSSIRGSNTSPELVVRRMLHSFGFRFRLHRKDLPGRPDIVLPKYNLAIFVHGCFWHRHKGCRYTTSPQSNKVFWQDKFRGNSSRDRKALRDLHALGWRTLVVWECHSKQKSANSVLRRRIEHIVKSNAKHTEFPRYGAR